MIIQSSSFDRICSKIRNTLYKKWFWRYGHGSRVSKSIWEKQFSNGSWDYLYSESEKAHYQLIASHVQHYAPEKSLLDVGCGQGVLYHYLKQNNNLKLNYSGIDLSVEAISIANRQFPEANFEQLDFDRSNLDKKFDVIIFNETLYYFNKPLKTIVQVINNNLCPNGYLIISMCEYIGHDVIWEKLMKRYHPLKKDTIENEMGQKWEVAVFKP